VLLLAMLLVLLPVLLLGHLPMHVRPKAALEILMVLVMSDIQTTLQVRTIRAPTSAAGTMATAV
jgi:hypothetical protein